MLKSTIFREYDIRGIADLELLSPDVEQLGRAIGTYIARNAGRKVNLGRDCRLSGQRLAGAMKKGLLASGCDVTDLGVVPTPLLYYSVFHLNSDGAVMITGSHNPPEYNGFKVVCGRSTIFGAEIQKLRALLETGDLTSGSGTATTYDVVTPYVDEIAAQFQPPKRVKVVVDAGNGTAGPAMHRVLERVCPGAVELFFEMDGNFPNHHPDSRNSRRPSYNTRRTWASPSTGTPTALAPSTTTARWSGATNFSPSMRVRSWLASRAPRLSAK
jgi:phosphomannomutase/phosphoglucomutase